jgi:hypothetical protein
MRRRSIGCSSSSELVELVFVIAGLSGVGVLVVAVTERGLVPLLSFSVGVIQEFVEQLWSSSPMRLCLARAALPVTRTLLIKHNTQFVPALHEALNKPVLTQRLIVFNAIVDPSIFTSQTHVIARLAGSHL